MGYPHVRTRYARFPYESAYPSLRQGLVGAWPFGMQGMGSIARDFSGRGKDGTLVMDSLTAWQPGKHGRTLQFDGVDDYINVSSFHPHSYSQFTIMCWYKSNIATVVDDQYIFVHGDTATASAHAVYLSVTDDVGQVDKVRFGIRVASSGIRTYFGTSDVVNQQWHHIAAVRTATNILIYVDGILELNTADLDAGLTVTPTAIGPYIADLPGETEQVNGLLDDIRIYNRPLSLSEVRLSREVAYAPWVPRRIYTASGGASVPSAAHYYYRMMA